MPVAEAENGAATTLDMEGNLDVPGQVLPVRSIAANRRRRTGTSLVEYALLWAMMGISVTAAVEPTGTGFAAKFNDDDRSPDGNSES